MTHTKLSTIECLFFVSGSFHIVHSDFFLKPPASQCHQTSVWNSPKSQDHAIQPLQTLCNSTTQPPNNHHRMHGCGQCCCAMHPSGGLQKAQLWTSSRDGRHQWHWVFPHFTFLFMVPLGLMSCWQLCGAKEMSQRIRASRKTSSPNKVRGRSHKEEQIREKAKQSISTVPLVSLQPHKTLPNTGSLTQSKPDLDPAPMNFSLAQKHPMLFLGPSFAVRHTVFKPPICHRLNQIGVKRKESWTFR